LYKIPIYLRGEKFGTELMEGVWRGVGWGVSKSQAGQCKDEKTALSVPAVESRAFYSVAN